MLCLPNRFIRLFEANFEVPKFHQNSFHIQVPWCHGHRLGSFSGIWSSMFLHEKYEHQCYDFTILQCFKSRVWKILQVDLFIEILLGFSCNFLSFFDVSRGVDPVCLTCTKKDACCHNSSNLRVPWWQLYNWQETTFEHISSPSKKSNSWSERRSASFTLFLLCLTIWNQYSPPLCPVLEGSLDCHRINVQNGCSNFCVDFTSSKRDDHFPFATFDRTFEADEKLFQDGFPLFLLMLANKTHAGQAWLFI